jgi:predicted methyltransferase
MNAKVFNALKPGGIYIVIDHVADPGTANAPDTAHRIDLAVLRSEIEAAGFRFEAEHDALRKSADDHTVMVMRPEIRGKTDQVIYKFRKLG